MDVRWSCHARSSGLLAGMRTMSRDEWGIIKSFTTRTVESKNFSSSCESPLSDTSPFFTRQQMNQQRRRR
eukprot:3731434-Pyramimonas_sp.AAC.1